MISCCGMELSWLSALAVFLVSATAKGLDFPFLLSGIFFLMAMFLAEYLSRRAVKRIWKISVWCLLFVPMIKTGLSSSGQTLLSGSAYDIYQSCLVIIVMIIFGYKGMSLSSRNLSYTSVCNHFDLGAGIISGLMILEMLIVLRGGRQISGDSGLGLAVVFFMFSMAAIFMARNSGSGITKYRQGFEILGTLISFGMVALLFAIGAGLFFLPGLAGVTRNGYDMFLRVAAPLKPYIIHLLKAVLIGSGNSPGTLNTLKGGGIKLNGTDVADHPEQWIDTIIGMGFSGLAALVLVAAGGFLLYGLFRWLMSGDTPDRGQQQKHSFCQRIFLWLLKIRHLLAGYKTRHNGWPVKSYLTLIRWGQNSGMPIRKSETPHEYGHRLSERFVPLEQEIKLVIHFFCLEIYGQQKFSEDAHNIVRKAVKSLRHPRFWVLRITSFFRGPGG